MEPKPVLKSKRANWLLIVLIILMILFIGAAVYLWQSSRTANSTSTTDLNSLESGISVDTDVVASPTPSSSATPINTKVDIDDEVRQLDSSLNGISAADFAESELSDSAIGL